MNKMRYKSFPQSLVHVIRLNNRNFKKYVCFKYSFLPWPLSSAVSWDCHSLGRQRDREIFQSEECCLASEESHTSGPRQITVPSKLRILIPFLISKSKESPEFLFLLSFINVCVFNLVSSNSVHLNCCMWIILRDCNCSLEITSNF